MAQSREPATGVQHRAGLLRDRQQGNGLALEREKPTFGGVCQYVVLDNLKG